MEDYGSPAQIVVDDVLVCVFKQLSTDWEQQPISKDKRVAARFIWFRSTLPLVCKRWNRLVLGTAALWTCLIVDPTAEATHVKRSVRQDNMAPNDEPRGDSGSTTPVRGASPLPGTSPDSDAGGYWCSQFAPYQVSTMLPGGSPPVNRMRQHLHRMSIGRHYHRSSLSAHALLKWLQQHPAVAAGVRRLILDLSHQSCHDIDRQQLEQLLCALPFLRSMSLIGAVEGNDAYEPLGRVRNLQELELLSASQACLEGGLFALSFLPSLGSLTVSLDINSASPCCLTELPARLARLKLGSMWLEGLPQQITELTGLTSVVLERCQVENNPLPLLLTLPQLASLTIRSASRASSSSGACQLVPMNQPQQQLGQLLAEAAALEADGHGRHRRHHQQHAAGGDSSSRPGGFRQGVAGLAAAGLGAAGSRLRGLRGGGSSNRPMGTAFTNTSILTLSLIDVGLQRLPSCVSQLVALEDLNLALNHDLGQCLDCLPQELSCLYQLKGLCLGHCGLNQLPAVVAALNGLTRLELQGNMLSVAGLGVQHIDVGFKHSLQILDLRGQGSARSRMRGIPTWVGSCYGLKELKLDCHCLGHGGIGSSHMRSGPIGVASLLHSTAATVPGSGGGGVASTAGGSPGSGGYYQYSFTHSPVSAVGNSLARVSGSASTGVASVLVEGLSLQQLPQLLPQLEMLCIEGGTWEHGAVRDALALVRQLERQGSKLQVVLPM